MRWLALSLSVAVLAGGCAEETVTGPPLQEPVRSMPPSLHFDRPFIFAIHERSSGALLFIGRVGDPSAH